MWDDAQSLWSGFGVASEYEEERGHTYTLLPGPDRGDCHHTWLCVGKLSLQIPWLATNSQEAICSAIAIFGGSPWRMLTVLAGLCAAEERTSPPSDVSPQRNASPRDDGPGPASKNDQRAQQDHPRVSLVWKEGSKGWPLRGCMVVGVHAQVGWRPWNPRHEVVNTAMQVRWPWL